MRRRDINCALSDTPDPRSSCYLRSPQLATARVIRLRADQCEARDIPPSRCFPPTCFDTTGIGRARAIWRGHKLGGNLRQTNYRCRPVAQARRHSIIRVLLRATRWGIRDLLTPAVDSELVNMRVPLTPRGRRAR